MSIQDITEKFKALIEDDTIYPAVLIVLVGCLCFGLGRLSMPLSTTGQPAGIVLSESEMPVRALSESGEVPNDAQGVYVASKNSDKYHLISCPGAARIKEGNKVWFQTKAEAEKAGYTPAGNCEGI